jgi:hypothetical protein
MIVVCSATSSLVGCFQSAVDRHCHSVAMTLSFCGDVEPQRLKIATCCHFVLTFSAPGRRAVKARLQKLANGLLEDWTGGHAVVLGVRLVRQRARGALVLRASRPAQHVVTVLRASTERQRGH